MAIEIQLPTVTLPFSTSECNLYAAHTPTIMRVQRKDILVTLNNNGSGFDRVICASSYPAGVAVGHQVYIQDRGLATVTAIINGTTFDVNTTFSTSLSAIYCNFLTLYPSYHISVKASKLIPPSTFVQAATLKVTPDVTGLSRVDLSPMARTAVQAVDAFPYNTAVTEDWNLYGSMKVEVAEFTNSLQAYQAPRLWQTVNAASPYPSRWYTPQGSPPTPVWYDLGANMAPYYTEATGQDKARFLSTVRKLRFWQGLPWSVEWVNSFGMNPSEVKALKENAYNVNGGTTTSEAVNVITISNNRLIRTTILGATPGAGAYPAGTKRITLQVVNEDNNKEFTEVLDIRYTDCLPHAPVYLKALDPAGGWRFFCFGARAVRGVRTANGDAFTRWVDNTAFKTESGRLLTKTARPTIVCGAELLDEYDRQIVDIILSSVEVQLLTNPLTWATFDPLNITYETPQWVTVIVRDGDFDTGRNKTLNEVTMTLELPEVPQQRQ